MKINGSTTTSRRKTTKTKTTNNCRRFSTITQTLTVFFLGCTFTATILLQLNIPPLQDNTTTTTMMTIINDPSNLIANRRAGGGVSSPVVQQQKNNNNKVLLNGMKILVAVVAYDFSQVPHLEELLDSYYDLCAGGSHVDVVIYSTVPWPVRYIDMLNTRFPNYYYNTNSDESGTTSSSGSGGDSTNGKFQITVHLKSPDTRLHLVDYHRELFYEKLDEYDLFIYTEDDIRVGPGTVSTYLAESNTLESLVGKTDAVRYYNVGVVRYEYSFPSNMIIDDGTRHVTQNVTRVYWEHSWHPAVPKAVDEIPHSVNNVLPKSTYVHMQNHHQGMYLATRDRLVAWRDSKKCSFDKITDRPHVRGNKHQPSEGTQRVWMSSNQLYGKKHCGVQQVIPIDKFGALTVLHLPNKNYRRVGRKGRLGGANNDKADDSTKLLDKLPKLSDKLLTAMELHLEIRRKWPATPKFPYTGIQMINHVEGRKAKDSTLIQRMKDFEDYVKRGGVMNERDMGKKTLIAQEDDEDDSSSSSDD